MTTEIVPVPEVVLASEFPTPADRVAGDFNRKAKEWADSENAMSVRNREIALTAHTNATAAQEQAGIATAKAHEAAHSAQLAHDDALQTAADREQTGLDRAATAADRAQTALDREATAADRLATAADRQAVEEALALAEIPPMATQAEMEAGTETEPRSMSPMLVAQAIAANAIQKPLTEGEPGQVLVSQGEGLPPVWSDIVAGPMVLLATVEASNSATVSLEGLDATYDCYVISLVGVIPVEDGAKLRAELKVGGEYKSFGYINDARYSTSTSATTINRVTQQQPIVFSDDAGASNEEWAGTNLRFTLYSPVNPERKKQYEWFGSSISKGNGYQQCTMFGSGRYDADTLPISGIRFLLSAGNIAAGTFRLYGIKG